MNTKEEWINKAMASLDNADRASLNPLVKETILQRLRFPQSVRKGVTVRLLLKIAAMILLLVSLNIFTVAHFRKNTEKVKRAAGTIARDYFSYIDMYQL
jgi:hypothetical protein